MEFSFPAGGCLLTEIHFSDRLRDLFDHQPGCTVNDVELLKIGRQFRLSERAKLTLGRHQNDNDAIREITNETYVLLRSPGLAGPLGLVSGEPSEHDLQTAGAILVSYGKGKDQPDVEVLAESSGGEQRFTVSPMSREESQKLIV